MTRLPVGLASGLTAVTVVLLVSRIVPPTRRLGSRVRPYSVGSRTVLGRAADVGVLSGGGFGSGREPLPPDRSAALGASRTGH